MIPTRAGDDQAAGRRRVPEVLLPARLRDDRGRGLTERAGAVVFGQAPDPDRDAASKASVATSAAWIALRTSRSRLIRSASAARRTSGATTATEPASSPDCWPARTTLGPAAAQR